MTLGFDLSDNLYGSSGVTFFVCIWKRIVLTGADKPERLLGLNGNLTPRQGSRELMLDFFFVVPL